MIQKGFKFLNTFSFSLKHQIMFFIWESNQINRTIIRFNSIKVMNNPAFGQRFIMAFLPYHYMFKYITFTLCSKMRRIIYQHITTSLYRTPTFPHMRFIAFVKVLFPMMTNRPSMNMATVHTSNRRGMAYFPSAIYAIFRMFFPPFSHIFNRATHTLIITLLYSNSLVNERLSLK